MWAPMELTTPEEIEWDLAEALAKVLLAIHGGGGVDGNAAREHLGAVLGEGDREALVQKTYLLARLLIQVLSWLCAQFRDHR